MNTKSKIAFYALARGRVCRSLMTVASLLFALTISGRSQTSQPQPQTMVKIVCRYSGPDLPPDSPVGQPITIYRASDKYDRIEFAPDTVHKTHELRITSEPDAWSINLADRTAIHTLDKGPQFNVRHYVLWTPAMTQLDPTFQDLEFGSEAIFARQAQVKEIGMRTIDNKEAKAYLAKGGDREVTLYFDPNTDKPIRIDVTKSGKPEMSLTYLEYDTNMRFDPKLVVLSE